MRTAIAIDRRCVRVETAISISIARSIKDKNAIDARVRRGTTSRADAALGGRGAMTRASKRKAAAPVATTKAGARGAMRARETGARDGRERRAKSRTMMETMRRARANDDANGGARDDERARAGASSED